MTKQGDVFRKPEDRERAVISSRHGGDEWRAFNIDLYVRHGGAVPAEHLHPDVDERFTVVSGLIGFLLNGKRSIAEPGQTVDIPKGVPHDWWNAGEGEAQAVVTIQPAARFEACILNIFGLARDGKTDGEGMPNLLQLALFAREFSDVIQITRPHALCNVSSLPSLRILLEGSCWIDVLLQQKCRN